MPRGLFGLGRGVRALGCGNAVLGIGCFRCLIWRFSIGFVGSERAGVATGWNRLKLEELRELLRRPKPPKKPMSVTIKSSKEYYKEALGGAGVTSVEAAEKFAAMAVAFRKVDV